MARKTKNTAATAIALEASVKSAPMAVSDNDTGSKKPRKRQAPAPKAMPSPNTVSKSDGDEMNGAIVEKQIAGKLGLIANAVSKPKGATIGELTEATGWQSHTVRAALTRLRQRGIDAKLTVVDERKVYRLAEAGA